MGLVDAMTPLGPINPSDNMSETISYQVLWTVIISQQKWVDITRRKTPVTEWARQQGFIYDVFLLRISDSMLEGGTPVLGPVYNADIHVIVRKLSEHTNLTHVQPMEWAFWQFCDISTLNRVIYWRVPTGPATFVRHVSSHNLTAPSCGSKQTHIGYSSDNKTHHTSWGRGQTKG